MSKQMKPKPTEVEMIGKRLLDIKRRLRHANVPYSASCYDNQVFFANAAEDMQFLLDLVKRTKGEVK